MPNHHLETPQATSPSLEEAGGPLLNPLDRSFCLGECRTRLITTVEIDVFPFPLFVHEISSSRVRHSGALISPIRALVDPSHGILKKMADRPARLVVTIHYNHPVSASPATAADLPGHAFAPRGPPKIADKLTVRETASKRCQK